MARNIRVGFAYDAYLNVMRIYAYENVDFKEIFLTYLCPKYQYYMSYFSYNKAERTYCIYLNLAHNK